MCFKNVIFNFAIVIGIFKSSYDNVLRWMPHDLTDDKSTLVQVMAWCRQATSHYLNQCWPRSPTPYAVTRPQWVNPVWVDYGNRYEAPSIIDPRFTDLNFWPRASGSYEDCRFQCARSRDFWMEDYLHKRHMSASASPIADNLTVCSTPCSNWH